MRHPDSLRSAVVAFVITLALMPPLIATLRRRRVLDHPNARSSHERPTLRGGGLAPAIGASIAFATATATRGDARAALLVIAGGFGVIGLVEDVRGIPPLPRLAAQAAVAALGSAWLLHHLTGTWPWRVTFAVAVVVWIVGYANAFNFMDGINGISAAQVVVAGTAWWAIGRSQHVASVEAAGLILTAAALAFAPFNLPRAFVFLGDVGSYFLGAALAVVVVIGVRSGMAAEAMLGPLLIYLADTASTLARRVARHETWYLPHRGHVYQRINQRGASHAATTLVVTIAMAACSVLGAVSLGHSVAARVLADIGMAIVAGLYLIVPHALGRQPTGPSAEADAHKP